jgi:hypothetical protein
LLFEFPQRVVECVAVTHKYTGQTNHLPLPKLPQS